jgi:hypothetical protein
MQYWPLMAAAGRAAATVCSWMCICGYVQCKHRKNIRPTPGAMYLLEGPRATGSAFVLQPMALARAILQLTIQPKQPVLQ